ncbi:Phophatidylserine decarboxylase-domain-containing protein [Elsinoe ampelina]|uniref:Phophatidylserine decarboxylase-domain-containing protein n=1 Tax=Elsinoe ampelina TaxID=302913 RepID=A0A6A6G979_9PEZI|nr:Phophatidylserine decarboxylase-domain-containing protein [Elsinoe ampelina]
MSSITKPGSNAAAKFRQSQTLGHWLPKDRAVIRQWVNSKVKQANSANASLSPNIQKFSDFVTSNTVLNGLATRMFTEVPAKYIDDPTGQPQIRDFPTFINTLNTILVTGPEFYYKPDDPDAMGLIGFPINAILDWPMGTQSGYAFWYLPEVNQMFEPILADFTSFLGSSASQKLLAASTGGWVSQQAQTLLATKGDDGGTAYTFTQLYNCPNPSDSEYLGFQNWDQFFTREFNDNMRPVEVPNENNFLNNSCESAPLQYQKNVLAQDTFWLKGQPYSLSNMLNFNDQYVNQFVGGSVYQAFLSALSYHRWRSPVNGTVVDIFKVPGTYYSENNFQGFDPSAPNNSQPYISSVATRGIIYIQAEEPIGLMAIVYIGMAEVSSCEFTVQKNQVIQKGQELGMFHFGGSSHCMVFRPGLELVFNTPRPGDQTNLPVNSALALVQATGSR